MSETGNTEEWFSVRGKPALPSLWAVPEVVALQCPGEGEASLAVPEAVALQCVAVAMALPHRAHPAPQLLPSAATHGRGLLVKNTNTNEQPLKLIQAVHCPHIPVYTEVIHC